MQSYKELLKKYGQQGWWPIQGKYHLGDFSYPKNDKQRFEICLGAILTQNTAWKNVEKALKNLKGITPKRLIAMKDDDLKTAIRPAGYYNQKAKKLKIFVEFFIDLNGKTPSREDLLSLWGIGPETADSILLYAYNIPTFVVDTYTKRLFKLENRSYEEVKKLFESKLSSDHKLFQEFHALIVEHAKQLATQNSK